MTALTGLHKFKVFGVVEVEVVALDETDAKLEAQRIYGMDVRHIERPAICMAQVPGEGQNVCTLDKGHQGAHRCKASDVDERLSKS